MSTQTIVNNTGNQAHVDFDVSKVFIFGNEYQSFDFENTTGSELVLATGTLVGRVTATNNLEILKSAAVDGSQFPVGILLSCPTLAIGETRKVSVCIKGNVAEEKVILEGADTLETMITGRSIRDRIAGDTAGIMLRVTDELTDFDNQ